LAKETGDSSTMSTKRVYSNGKNRKDECSSGLEPSARTRSESEESEKRPLCDGDG